VPVHDDRLLFEFLSLEGAQAGLSWLTILKKRDNYRKAFDQFDFQTIATYTGDRVKGLLGDQGIVRNRLKIESVVKNSRGVLSIVAEHGSFSTYLWQFVDGVPIQNKWNSVREIPAKTDISEKMSRDLKSRGFNFVGPAICYAFMQAVGMVNDHLTPCFRHEEVGNLLI